MPAKIYVHADQKALELERTAYYGGRNECYRLGPQPDGLYYRLDVNSMYGSVMSTHRWPTRLRKLVNLPSIPELAALSDRYLCIASVTIETDIPLYPARLAGGTYYPTGRFSAVLPDAELLQALDRGHIVSVERVATYDSEILFQSFVDYFYGLRLSARAAGDQQTERFAKLLINSLYGKWGQRGARCSRSLCRSSHRSPDEKSRRSARNAVGPTG